MALAGETAQVFSEEDMEVIRTYQLAIYPNAVKLDTARYTYERHLQHVNIWTGKLFFNGNKAISTEGMGQLCNQAQHKARGIIRALTQAAKETGGKTNVPVVKQAGCPAKIQASETPEFDYWMTVENEFERKGGIKIPCKSHKKLNGALRDGWVLNNVAEFFQDKNGKFYARVFVQKEVKKAEKKEASLGCDVGYRNAVIRSDRYIGQNISMVIKQERQKQASRQRNGLKVKRALGLKSRIKQVLDIEANAAVRRSCKASLNLVVESPKVLANLRSGKLHGWARNYFANRCQVLGKEHEVFVWEINPAYTSQTCFKCGHVDKQSRVGVSFVCVSCGHSDHADINAARNIARKGTESLRKLKRSGSVNVLRGEA